jgi:hypothetical protein
VLEETSVDDTLTAEQRWLDRERPEFNATPNAMAPMKGQKATAEHRRKISAALKGRVSNRLGSTMPIESRAKISAALIGNHYHRGKKASALTKSRMSIAQTARWAREKQIGSTHV